MGWNISGKKRKKSSSLNSKNVNSRAKNSFKKSKALSPSSDTKKNTESNSKKAKKTQTLMTLVEAMKPSSEELQFRKDKSKEVDNQLLSKSLECTKCNKKLKFNSDENNKIQMHPCLGVLMCQSCCNYYGDGEFSLDSEGEDKYCRWCGEGGTIFGCSQCICGFCSICIKKHFGFEYLKKVQQDDNWLCFFCNPKPLWHKRYICSLGMQMPDSRSNETSSLSPQLENGRKGSSNQQKSIKTYKKSIQKQNISKTFSSELSDSDSSTDFENWGTKSPPRKKSLKRNFSNSSIETDSQSPETGIKRTRLSKKNEGPPPRESFESSRQLAVDKLERILKLSEYQMTFGVKWSSQTLKKLSDPNIITTKESLRNECEKIKWFLSVLSSYLIEFCNSVDLIEKSLSVSIPKDDSNDSSQKLTEPTGFSTIMQFLNFVTNQVKMFMKKGFTVTDVIDAEIFDDNKFIGIKKKSGASTSDGSPKKVSFKNSTFDLEKKENAPLNSPDTDDDSQNEGSMRLVVDEEFDDDGAADFNSSGTSAKNGKKSSPSKEDILHILEILENA